MDIRSITLFTDPLTTDGAQMANFIGAARDAFPVPVQSMRVAAPPFPDWWPPRSLTEEATSLAAKWQAAGIDYISLGPVQLHHDADWLQLIPALLTATDAIFATAEIANTDGHIDIDRCHRVAGLIKRISKIKENGFGNLYFAALANCAPGSPFFPVAYHDGPTPRFAIAVESADLALQAVQESHDLETARARLVSAIETAAAQLTPIAAELAATHNVAFGGIDFSLAPFPTDDKSLGGTMEALGLSHIGAAGSLFAAAFVTEAIDRADFPPCGFSGLMLPVLEDSVLARRAARRQLTLQDLLSYAAVCGTGLDTVPLAGDVSQDALTAVLLDVAALAVRLDKPLTARLMPMPDLRPGDAVTFDFPYFANSRVMPIVGDALTGPLAQPAHLSLRSITDR